ncbi:alpha/beta hydrolase [Sphingomonas sanguinis]|jgi:acetyl esterase/lipase|uniref:Alpha/beta hydrolase n=1 Tax=Sphingomonas sanguinis TaxID=33051 RepID=A0A7Y7QW19_9SPHN|nr:alpha/beta hydrolase [Sphingomonas sanguinis]MBZ6382178.1 alpha/beta hydrolase [Sphingomonas sanguinis]NNG50764.1 alpha/beta hydrolase [Sphingomonas sanguinis]NNG54448.1 alpha/beta hydrolase [Sphingomonas sanguinis]NVP31476.1 alpha/beta hydrolase [Sphingomonas sanguinis]
MTLDRRTLIAAGLSLAATPRVAIAASAASRFPIWPATPPGMPGPPVVDDFVLRSPNGPADNIAWPHVATPMLTVCPATKPTGAAVLLIPGGGYARVAVGRAPSPVARWFAAQGVTAFDLLYRLPHDGWAAGPDAPLQDAQRALRVIRSRAREWGIDPTNIAAMGFSAGGHLAARLASRSALETYSPVDTADSQPTTIKAVGLLFPAITMTESFAHGQSKHELLGKTPDATTTARYSAELNLPADMPPTFLGHAADDPVVPVANSIAMFQAVHALPRPAELHIVETGGHGPRLIGPDGKPHPWLARFATFAHRHGLNIPGDDA